MVRVRAKIEKSQMIEKNTLFGRSLVRVKALEKNILFGTTLVRIKSEIEKNTFFGRAIVRVKQGKNFLVRL